MSQPYTGSSHPRCTATNKDGSRCAGRVWSKHLEDGLCWPHNPASAGLRSQGGRKSRANARAVDSEAPEPSDIAGVLEYSIAQTLKGDQSEGILRARATMVKALEAHKSRVGDEVDEPIEELRSLTDTEQAIVARRAAEVVIEMLPELEDPEVVERLTTRLAERFEWALEGGGAPPIKVVLHWPKEEQPPGSERVPDPEPPAEEKREPSLPDPHSSPQPEASESELPSWAHEPVEV